VYIFAEDVVRLLDHLKMGLDEFLEKHVDVEEGPSLTVKYEGQIPMLMFKEVGDKDACHFQDEKGRCTIHMARPFQCSGYPFWKMNIRNKETWTKLANACPGVAASKKIKGATFYPAAVIMRLVQQEIDTDILWERVMAEWKGDYKGYLRFYLDRRAREKRITA
jgi:Fe-S-cluster containining protein